MKEDLILLIELQECDSTSRAIGRKILPEKWKNWIKIFWFSKKISNKTEKTRGAQTETRGKGKEVKEYQRRRTTKTPRSRTTKVPGYPQNRTCQKYMQRYIEA